MEAESRDRYADTLSSLLLYLVRVVRDNIFEQPTDDEKDAITAFAADPCLESVRKLLLTLLQPRNDNLRPGPDRNGHTLVWFVRLSSVRPGVDKFCALYPIGEQLAQLIHLARLAVIHEIIVDQPSKEETTRLFDLVKFP